MNDEEIVRLLKNRDETALTEINNKYGNKCRAIAKEILGSDSDAQECFNDVLLRVWNNVPEKRRKKSIPPEQTEPLENLENMAVYDRKPGDEEAAAEKIARFLSEISAEKRNAFILRYYYELTEKEIGKKMGLPTGTVSSYISRTKKALKKQLQKEGIHV